MRDIKELEHEGDRLTHELVDLVNRTFVTPFDRDDMYRLAGALDDICDYVDDAAEKVVALRRPARSASQAQRPGAGRSTARRASSPRRSAGSRASRTRSAQLIELRELEDEGDRIVRDAISSLFTGGADPLVAHPLEGHPRGSSRKPSTPARTRPNVLEAILVKNR